MNPWVVSDSPRGVLQRVEIGRAASFFELLIATALAATALTSQKLSQISNVTHHKHGFGNSVGDLI
jgi:hypothetical protein